MIKEGHRNKARKVTTSPKTNSDTKKLFNCSTLRFILNIMFVLFFKESLCQSMKLMLFCNYLCYQKSLLIFKDCRHHSMKSIPFYSYLCYTSKSMISHDLFYLEMKSKIYDCLPTIFTLNFKTTYQLKELMLSLLKFMSNLIFYSLYYQCLDRVKKFYVLKKHLAWLLLDTFIHLHFRSLKNLLPKNCFNMFYLEAFMKRPALAIVKIFNNLK